MAQDQNLFTDEELKKIINDDLLEQLGMGNASDQEKLDAYEQITQNIEDRVLFRVDDNLNDEDKKLFGEIINSGDQAKANEFLLSRNLNVPQLLVEEAMLYKVEIMSLMKLSKQGAAKTTQEG